MSLSSSDEVAHVRLPAHGKPTIGKAWTTLSMSTLTGIVNDVIVGEDGGPVVRTTDQCESTTWPGVASMPPSTATVAPVT